MAIAARHALVTHQSMLFLQRLRLPLARFSAVGSLAERQADLIAAAALFALLLAATHLFKSALSLFFALERQKS